MIKVKGNYVLYSALILTIVLEIILIALVYNKVGGSRLPIQTIRLAFQLVLILWVLISKSNTSLFMLTSYHIITGLLILYSSSSNGLFQNLLMYFHIGIGLIIYFNDIIEIKLIKSVKN